MDENNIMRLADIPDESPEDVLWKQTRRIGVAEFSPDTSEIKLHVYGGLSTYNIDLDERKSLELWLRRIESKTWATSAVLGDLVKCWFRVDEELAESVDGSGQQVPPQTTDGE